MTFGPDCNALRLCNMQCVFHKGMCVALLSGKILLMSYLIPTLPKMHQICPFSFPQFIILEINNM